MADWRNGSDTVGTPERFQCPGLIVVVDKKVAGLGNKRLTAAPSARGAAATAVSSDKALNTRRRDQFFIIVLSQQPKALRQLFETVTSMPLT